MKVLYALRIGISCLVLIAVTTIVMRLSAERPDFSHLNFWSYFTNQSNLMVACFYLWDSAQRFRKKPLNRSVFDRTRAALTLYLIMTTSIYWLFLHRLLHFSDPAVSLANIFQHSGCLLFLFLDTVWDRPQSRFDKRNLAIWFIYPVLYAIGILVQGAIRHWYPYPFLNIEKLGLVKWLSWNLSIAVTISLIGFAIVGISNQLHTNQN